MVEQKLQRYVAASVGMIFATVWSLAGITSAAICLVAGAACYGAAVVSQRGTVRQIIETMRVAQAQHDSRPPRPRPAKSSSRAQHNTARPARRPQEKPEFAPVYSEPDSRESLAAQYGW